MREVMWVHERWNVVEVQFIHHGVAAGLLYSWYLSVYAQRALRVGAVTWIQTKGRRRRVLIVALRHELDAKRRYLPFLELKGSCSWQVQTIARFLAQRGFVVYRERRFRGLTNPAGIQLPVDLSFKVNGRWVFIEYNGMHHYGWWRQKRPNMARNMQRKWAWCLAHHVPLLEIPYWWQGELEALVGRFLLTLAPPKTGLPAGSPVREIN